MSLADLIDRGVVPPPHPPILVTLREQLERRLAHATTRQEELAIGRTLVELQEGADFTEFADRTLRAIATTLDIEFPAAGDPVGAEGSPTHPRRES